MKNKILIVGNSVGIRIRPNSHGTKNYADLLADESEVVNKCFTGNMIGSVSRVPDFILQEQPSVIVVQFGVVELSSRSTTHRLYSYMNYKAKRTKIGAFTEFFLKGMESKLRRLMVMLRFQRAWYRKDRFIKEYQSLLSGLTKDTSAKVICIGVNTPGDRVEKQLPGSRSRIKSANAEIAKICKDLNNVHFIDVEDIASEMIPDGIHYNEAGHKVMYDRISAILGK